MGRFHDYREPQIRFFTAGHVKRRGWQTGPFPQLLGAHLVHTNGRCHHPGPGVGNFQMLQYTLDHTVFAAATVQGNEGGIKAFQRLHALVRRVHQLCDQAQIAQALMHRRTALQRHRALCGFAAGQHRHAAHPAQSLLQCTLIHGGLPEQPAAWQWHRHYRRPA